MAIMGIVEREQRHCLFFYKLDGSETKKPRNLVFAETDKPPTKEAEKNEELSLQYVQTIRVEDAIETKEPAENEVKIELPRKPKKQQHTASENVTHRFFSRKYAPFLLNDGVRFVVVMSYMAYIIMAVVGCLQFREGLEPSHLVTDDHYIAHYFGDMKMFWKVGPQLHIALKSPPNFTESVQRCR